MQFHRKSAVVVDLSSSRYSSRNPIQFWGGLNLYEYACGNPVIYIDPFGLCWIYRQSTEKLTLVDNEGSAYVGTGYAGYGMGLNNPSMQNIPDTSPLSHGQYTIGPQHTNTTQAGVTFPGSMRLTPNPNNQMYERDGFLIHGPHANDKHNSSEGFPVFNKNVRI